GGAAAVRPAVRAGPPPGRAATARADRRRLPDRLRRHPLPDRVRARTGRAAWLPLARRDHGPAAVAADDRRRRRLRLARPGPPAGGRTPGMTATPDLATLLARRIDAEGPMPLADYMALALGHPEFGYYATRDPLGAAGDFITAPEIS